MNRGTGPMTINHTSKQNIELIYRLKGLGMAGSVLHIGAHPDDEDVGLMAYMARKMGVGLAIVHNIVTNALHGTITVESEPGQGTMFTVILPQTVPD